MEKTKAELEAITKSGDSMSHSTTRSRLVTYPTWLLLPGTVLSALKVYHTLSWPCSFPLFWLMTSDPRDFSIRELFSRKGVQKVEHEYQLEQVMENSRHGVEQRGEHSGFHENGTVLSASKRKGITFSEWWEGDKRLPNWCRLIGWFICISYILVSSYIVCLYGLSYGRIKSLLWLSSVVLAVFKRALLVQPLNILIMAVLESYAKTIAGLDGEHLKKTQMAEESDEKIKEVSEKISEPNLLQRLQEEKIKLRHLTGKTVQPLSREEVNALGLKERRWHEANCRAHDIMALLLYIITLHIIAYGAGDALAWNNAHVMEKAIVSGEHNQETQGPELNNIWRYKDLIDYLNQTALPSLHAVRGFSDLPLPEDEGWTSHLPSKLIGTPRLRQIRFTKDVCRIPREYEELGGNRSCLPHHGRTTIDTHDYGSGWKVSNQSMDSTDRSQMLWVHRDSNETQSFPMSGELNTYPGNGYSINLGRHLLNSRHILRYVRDSGWIDRRTTALILEFSVYNADANLFTVGHVLIERSPLGTFKTSHQLLTTRLLVTHFGEKKWGTVSHVAFVIATLLLLWRQCRRLYLSRTFHSQRSDEMEMTSAPHDETPLPKWKRLFLIFFHPSPRQGSMWDQIKDVFNSKRPRSSHDEGEEEEEGEEEDLKGLLSKRKTIPTVDPDLLSSTPAYPLFPLSAPSLVEWLLILMSVVILIVYIERSKAMHEPLQRLDRGASSNERHKFVSLLMGVRWDYVYKYALAFDLCIATTALWRALPSFRLLPQRALIRSGRGPLPTMTICFGVFLLAFAFGAYSSSIFGSATHEFSSVQQSLSTLCAWALGAATTEEVLRVGIWGKVLHCAFVLGCSVYIVNLFLTIVMEDFGKAQSEIKKKKLNVAEVREYGVFEFVVEYWRRNKPSCKSLRRGFICEKVCSCIVKRNAKATLEVSELDDGVAHGNQRVVETLTSEIQENSFSEIEEPREGSGNDGESSSNNAELSSTQSQLRLRDVGPTPKTREDTYGGLTALGHALENRAQAGDYHLRTRQLLIALLRRTKAHGSCVKELEWKNTQEIANWLPSCDEKSSEEYLIDRMKAITAIAINICTQKNTRNDLESSQRVK